MALFSLCPITVAASLMPFLPQDTWKRERSGLVVTVRAKFILRDISIQVVIPELWDKYVMFK